MLHYFTNVYSLPDGLKRQALQRIAVLSAGTCKTGKGEDDFRKLCTNCPSPRDRANGFVDESTEKDSPLSRTPMVSLCNGSSLLSSSTDSLAEPLRV